LPFTYLSHQAPVLAVKMRWPAFFDGTAMVAGSMAPDWAYALSDTPLAFDGHSIGGVVAFCVPAAVAAAWVLRRVAPVLFAYVPSAARLPLRQLRALVDRRPPLVVTVASALVGAVSHVGWDLFTHPARWGPQHIAWLRSPSPSLLGRTVTWASALQYAGHVGGALVAVYLLSRILTSGSFRRWYGIAPEPVVDGTSRPPAGALRFWAVVTVGVVAGLAAATIGHPGLPGRIIRLSLGAGLGLVAASRACATTPSSR